MSLGGSSNKSNQSSQYSSTYDPALTGLLTSRAHAADAFAGSNGYQPYSGTPLNTDKTASMALSGYQAPQVSAGQLASTDLTPYLNPFTNDVINTSNADLQRANQIQQTNDASQATASGAFGGSRSAVLSNLDNESYLRALASTDAGLHQANFNQAQGAAGQDIASRLSAAMSNQQASLAGAGTRLQAQSLTNQGQQADYNAAYGQYQNAQQYPLQLQQLINQAYGLVPSSPLTSGTSNGSSSGFGFSIAGK